MLRRNLKNPSYTSFLPSLTAACLHAMPAFYAGKPIGGDKWVSCLGAQGGGKQNWNLITLYVLDLGALSGDFARGPAVRGPASMPCPAQPCRTFPPRHYLAENPRRLSSESAVCLLLSNTFKGFDLQRLYGSEDRLSDSHTPSHTHTLVPAARTHTHTQTLYKSHHKTTPFSHVIITFMMNRVLRGLMKHLAII